MNLLGLREPNDKARYQMLNRIVSRIPVQTFIGSSILPDEPVYSDKAMWDIIFGGQQMARFVAPEEEAPMIDDEKKKTMFAELAYIRVKKSFSETDLQVLREAGDLPVEKAPALQGRAAEVNKKIRHYLDKMKGMTMARKEWMIWNALQGNIRYNDQCGVKFCVDFGIPSCNQVTASPSWCGNCTTSGNILCDIETWTSAMRDQYGVEITRIYGSRRTLKWMMFDSNIRDLFKRSEYAIGLASVSAFKKFFQNITDLQYITVDEFYTCSDDEGTPKTRMLPANKLIFLPENTGGEILGDVAIGPAPYAINNGAPGVFSWREDKVDPWRTFVGVGMAAFPRLYHPEWILVAEVCPTEHVAGETCPIVGGTVVPCGNGSCDA